jgi:hypothetical protein
MRSAPRLWDSTHRVSWDRVVCRIDGPSVNHVSLILLADHASNQRLLEWIERVEGLIERAGVPVHVPRRNQQPFHVTVGVVDGASDYRIDRVLDDVNRRLSPGSWHDVVLPHIPDIPGTHIYDQSQRPRAY